LFSVVERVRYIVALLNLRMMLDSRDVWASTVRGLLPNAQVGIERTTPARHLPKTEMNRAYSTCAPCVGSIVFRRGTAQGDDSGWPSRAWHRLTNLMGNYS